MVKDSPMQKKQWATGAFKSTRVINGQSMEMLGKGVLDVRILHRFGLVSEWCRKLLWFRSSHYANGLRLWY